MNDGAADLSERLERRARDDAGGLALRILEKDGFRSVGWADLRDLAVAGHAAYVRHGLRRRDRVLVALPTSRAFLAAILGGFRAGVVPSALPTLAPGKDEDLLRAEWRSRIAAVEPAAIVADAPPPVEGPLWIDPAELAVAGAAPPAVAPEPEATVWIQFSSGTTSAPKGILLSHAAVHANLEAMAERLAFDETDSIVSWLPMYHDMGFFGCLLLPLWDGRPVTLLDPSAFVQNPLRWFKVMSESRATVTATPPSALATCLKLLRRFRDSPLDVSAMRQFIVGAELVAPRLVEEFERVLGPHGGARRMLRPVYGLAEATLAVTMPVLGRLPRVDVVDRRALEDEGRAEPGAGASAEAWTGVGTPLRATEIRIADAAGHALPERRVGRILLRTPSLATGLDEMVEVDGVPWLDTGDLGYRADGDLFVTGRVKDLIIRRGRNLSPERIEELAERNPAVQAAAAFGLYDEATSTERVVLVVETRLRKTDGAEERDRLRLAIRGDLADLGYEIDDVRLVPRGSLPRTTSGKLRRRQARETYLREGRSAA